MEWFSSTSMCGSEPVQIIKSVN
uniref:Uncharacterized protein MANES_10G060900 n=1 Tax=Rhizophora mucronata TaxID=61149 RepID=A0A2P2M0D9_RHIMU